MKIDPHKAGLALGITFVIYHAVWLVSLVLGFGDLWFKWVGGLHFVEITYSLKDFDVVTGVVGLVGAFVSGYIMGWVFGYVWQRLERSN